MIKISIPNDVTLVWSTKLHLFLYRLLLSLQVNDEKMQTLSNDNNKKTETIVNHIEFEIDTCAHVYLQLSNDCRYIQSFSRNTIQKEC
jgi:hypothetical protein